MAYSVTDKPNDYSATSGTHTGIPALRILVLLCIAQLVMVLTFQSVAIALPAIQAGFGMSPSVLQWVITANELAFGGALLLMGRATDLFGRQRMFIGGLALFGLASVACGLAPGTPILIAARALQGLGAAMMTPAALALLSTTYAEGADRNWAFGIWGAVGPVGGTLGIVVGGTLAARAGWPWIFFVGVPIIVGAIVVATRLLDRQPHASAHPRLDLAGALLGTTGIGMLVFALTNVQQGLSGLPLTAGSLVLALALLIGFWILERRVRDPLLPPALMRRRGVAVVNGATLMHAATTNTPVFFFALYMQDIRGYSPLQTGLAFLPVNAGIVVGSFLGSRLTQRLGARVTMAGSMACICVALLLHARIAVASDYVRDLLPALLLIGFGVGGGAVAVNVAGTAGIDAEEHGLAWGILNTSVRIGTALGLAVLVTVATLRTTLVQVSAEPSHAALISGYQYAFIAGAIMALIGVMLALRLPRQSR